MFWEAKFIEFSKFSTKLAFEGLLSPFSSPSFGFPDHPFSSLKFLAKVFVKKSAPRRFTFNFQWKPSVPIPISAKRKIKIDLFVIKKFIETENFFHFSQQKTINTFLNCPKINIQIYYDNFFRCFKVYFAWFICYFSLYKDFNHFRSIWIILWIANLFIYILSIFACGGNVV